MKRLAIILALFLCISGIAKEVTIDPDHTMLINDEVSQELTDSAKHFIFGQESNGASEILVLINSPGGSILDGISLADTIKNSKMKSVCVVDGLAASMAAVILQYCTERYATKSSVIMFHNGSTSMSGNVAFLSAELDFVNKISRMMDEVAAKRLGLSYDELKSKQNTEWWMVGSDEALKGKAIDDEAVLRLKPREMKPSAAPAGLPSLEELLQSLQPDQDSNEKQEVPRKVNQEGFRHMLENLK